MTQFKNDNFFQRDYSTVAEQDQVFTNRRGTGIQDHGYTGEQQGQFFNDVISPLNLGSPLFESNGGSFLPGNGSPVFEYPPTAMIDCLPVYKHNPNAAYLMEAYRDFLWSSEYFWYCISLPYNSDSALITWRQTFRDQVDVPPNSFLVAIQARAFTSEGDHFVIPTNFRLQIYDDGAGEYLYNASVGTGIAAGNDTAIAASGNAFGPFMLPSPLSIVPNGMIVVSMTNVEATGTPASLTVGAIRAYVGLVFAVPKNCGVKNVSATNRTI